MELISLKLPRKIKSLEVISASNIPDYDVKPYFTQDREFLLDYKFEETEFQEKEEIKIEVISEPEPVLVPVKSYFTHEFTIENTSDLVEISLDKISDDVSLDIVREEVQKAYDHGFEDGRQITASTLEMEIQKQQEWIRRIDEITLEFKKQYYSKIINLDSSLITLASMIAEHILEHELSKNSQIVIEQVIKVIDSLKNDKVFSIRLHPDNVSILEQSSSKLTDIYNKFDDIEIIADNNCDLFGCILETSAGVLDSRLSTQLELIKNKIDSSLETEDKYDENIIDEIENQI